VKHKHLINPHGNMTFKGCPEQPHPFSIYHALFKTDEGMWVNSSVLQDTLREMTGKTMSTEDIDTVMMDWDAYDGLDRRCIECHITDAESRFRWILLRD
jgi:hypothetical protein